MERGTHVIGLSGRAWNEEHPVIDGGAFRQRPHAFIRSSSLPRPPDGSWPSRYASSAIPLRRHRAARRPSVTHKAARARRPDISTALMIATALKTALTESSTAAEYQPAFPI